MRSFMVRVVGVFLLALPLFVACGAPSTTSVLAPPPPATSPVVTAPVNSASSSPTKNAVDGPLVCPVRSYMGLAAFVPGSHALLTTCSGSPTICGDTSAEPGGHPDDHFVDVWDAEKGRLTESLDAGLSNVRELTFSQSHMVATVADPTTGGGEVRVFDPQSWKPLAKVEAYCIQSVLFDDKGSRLAISGADGQLHAVDTHSWKVTSRPIKDAHIGGDTGVGLAFDPTGKTLLVRDDSAGNQLVDAATLRLIRSKAPDRGLATSALSPKADWMATVTTDGALDVIDMHSLVPTHRGKDDALVGTTIYAVDPERFLTVGANGELAMWNVHDKTPSTALGQADGRSSVVFDKTRSLMAVATVKGSLRIWDLKKLGAARELSPQSGGTDSFPQMAFSPAADRLAIADELGGVTVWDVAKARVVASLPQTGKSSPEAPPLSFDWTHDGAFLLAASNGETRILRMSDGESVTLTVFDDHGKREGVVRTKEGMYAGTRSLAACAMGRDSDVGTSRPSLLSDFLH